MAWDETKTNMSVVGSDLQLDEGWIEGSYDTGSLDIGTLAWQHVRILIKVEEDPAATGFAAYTVQIKTSANGADWTSYVAYQEGEYYCRYIRVLITVTGDPTHDQRPKITLFQIQAGESDSFSAQPSVTSSVAAVPATPALGQRHIITADNTIATCVDAATETWRYTQPKVGMTAYDANSSGVREYDGSSWKLWSQRDLQVNSLGVGMAATGVAGQIKAGDGTNYFATAADGEVSLAGTARVIKDVVIRVADVIAGATAPTPAIVGNFSVLQFAGAGTTDELYYEFYPPDDWDSTTEFSVHIYWAPVDGNAGDVKWQMDYVALQPENNEVLTAAVTSTSVVDSTQTLQDELLRTGDMTISGVAVDDVVGVRIYRDPTDGADTYGSAASFVMLHVQYISNKLGKAT